MANEVIEIVEGVPPVVEVVTGVPGPVGPPGPTGPAGPVGATGPQGPAGVVPADVVIGPASSTDNTIALFSGTTGKAINADDDGKIGGSIAIGANPAQSGTVRLPNQSHVMARNGLNTADVSMMVFDTANHLLVRETLVVNPTGTIYPMVDNAPDLGWTGGRFRSTHVGTSVNIGTNPAQSGALRLANNQAIKARSVGNSADLSLVKSTTGDNIEIGDGTTQYVSVFAAQKVVLPVVLLNEQTGVPLVPGSNQANLWLEDNGAGKSRLMIQFATGAAVQIAIQP